MVLVVVTQDQDGWAAIILRGKRELMTAGTEEQTTNNRMELTAVVSGLEMLYDGEEAIVYSDSQYVVNGTNAWLDRWIENGWVSSTGKVKNIDLWKKILELKDRHKITVMWQKGHSTEQMERADLLARSRGVMTEKLKMIDTMR